MDKEKVDSYWASAPYHVYIRKITTDERAELEQTLRNLCVKPDDCRAIQGVDGSNIAIYDSLDKALNASHAYGFDPLLVH